MSRQVVQRNALEDIKARLIECLPVQVIEVHVMPHIYAQISSCTDCPAGMLEFLFVSIDRYISADEVFDTTCVVQMEMTHDDGFHVLDIIARGFDCGW